MICRLPVTTSLHNTSSVFDCSPSQTTVIDRSLSNGQLGCLSGARPELAQLQLWSPPQLAAMSSRRSHPPQTRRAPRQHARWWPPSRSLRPWHCCAPASWRPFAPATDASWLPMPPLASPIRCRAGAPPSPCCASRLATPAASCSKPSSGHASSDRGCEWPPQGLLEGPTALPSSRPPKPVAAMEALWGWGCTAGKARAHGKAHVWRISCLRLPLE